MSNKIAIVRVRGKVKVKKVVEDTLRMLRLYNKNYCVIIDNSQTANGMIQKVKDYVTFGEVSDKIFLELVIKRGEIYSGRTQDSKGKIKYLRRYFEYDNKKYNKYFRLAPPKKDTEV